MSEATGNVGPDPGKQSRLQEGIPVIPELDGFRAMTVLAVIGSHAMLFSGLFLAQAGTTLAEWVDLLSITVDAFFIISGFVLFLPVVVNGGDLGSVKGFAIRRAARVVPAYWFVLVLILALIAFVPVSLLPNQVGGAELEFPGPFSILAHFLFLQTPLVQLHTASEVGFGLNGPLWTLSVEILFYVVLPFVARPYFRHPLIGLAIAAAISLAWRYSFAHFAGIAPLVGVEDGSTHATAVILQSDYQLPNWAFSFGVGMTSAWAYVRLRSMDQDVVRRWARAIQPAAIVACLVLMHLCYVYGIEPAFGVEPANAAGIGRRAPLPTMAYTASIGILILSTAMAPSWQRWPWSNRLARWLADVSYGTYLIHFVVMAYLLVTISPPQTGTFSAFLTWFAITTPIAVAYGYLSARFIERPIRRWAHKFGRRSAGRPAPSRGRLVTDAEGGG